MSRVTFLTRATCSLCHRALPWVEREAARRGHDLVVTDVDVAGLDGQYGDRVPVVLRDGDEVLAGRFDARQVARALR